MTKPLQNITLIGMPGSGKSTVGVLLAKALGFGFLDTDLVIQHRENTKLQTLVDTLGVDGFLDIEQAAIQTVDCIHHVVSPGGSVVCRHEAISHLKTLGPVVYLDVPLPELLRRIQNLSTRGIAMKPSQSLKDVMALREPLYHQYADIVLPCHASQSLEDTVEAVLIALKKEGY